MVNFLWYPGKNNLRLRLYIGILVSLRDRTTNPGIDRI